MASNSGEAVGRTLMPAQGNHGLARFDQRLPSDRNSYARAGSGRKQQLAANRKGRLLTNLIKEE